MRRSRRLSGADALCNGITDDAALGSKKMKLDNGKINNSQKNKKDNNKVKLLKELKISESDKPLKERRKSSLKRLDEEKLVEESSAGLNQNILDVEFDKASTSHTCTDNTAPMPMDLNSMAGDSLATLLGQGLISSDAQKIDAVLSKTDLRTISATLNDLSVTQIVPLLKEIDYRCRNRKRLDIGWIRWLQNILSKHMAYLSTIGTLKSQLSTLFTWSKQHTDNLNQLLEVSGKLALVNDQISRRMCPEMFASQQAAISFEDDGDALSDDSDDMNEFENDEESEASSIDNWWDDDEVASENEDLASSGDEKKEGKQEDEEMSDDENDNTIRMVIN